MDSCGHREAAPNESDDHHNYVDMERPSMVRYNELSRNSWQQPCCTHPNQHTYTNYHDRTSQNCSIKQVRRSILKDEDKADFRKYVAAEEQSVHKKRLPNDKSTYPERVINANNKNQVITEPIRQHEGDSREANKCPENQRTMSIDEPDTPIDHKYTQDDAVSLKQIYMKGPTKCGSERHYFPTDPSIIEKTSSYSSQSVVPKTTENIPVTYSESRNSNAAKELASNGLNSAHLKKVQKFDYTGYQPYTSSGLGYNIVIPDELMKTCASNQSITVKCILDDYATGEPHARVDAIEAAKDLEKSKSLIMKLLDKELEKLKINDKNEPTSGNSRKICCNCKENGSNSQIKHLKMACIQRIDAELATLKELEFL